MIQLGLLIVCLFIFILYLKEREGKSRPRSEIERKIELFKSEVMKFLRRARQAKTKTRIRRLEIEWERFQKAMRLDEILEKAEQERNPRKAIDYYLEAFSFISKNNFELNRKKEIEAKIKTLQEKIGSRAYSNSDR